MYSKNQRRLSEPVSVPPRYSGVRFRHDATPTMPPKAPPREEERPISPPETPPVEVSALPAEKKAANKGFLDSLSGIFGNIGEDDILLAALIIILAGEGKSENREALLLLILLLCIR